MRMRAWWKKRGLVLVAAGSLSLACGPAQAVNYGFVGGSPRADGKCYWENAANWQGGYYGGFIGANSVCYFDGGSATIASTQGGLQVGYYGSTGSLNGRGTLRVVADTLTIQSSLVVGKLKYGAGERTGTLYVQGGTLFCAGVADNGTDGVNDVHVLDGILDCGYGSVNHAISGRSNMRLEFAGGTIRNLTTARVTTLSGSGLITNLTGVLTLDVAQASRFSGNVHGSGGGTILKTNSVALTFAPGGVGTRATMALVGLAASRNVTFHFDLTSPGGSNDLIVVGSGGLTVDPGTAIVFGTPPTAPGHYRLFGGTFGSPDLGNFVLPEPEGEYSLSTEADPGYIVLSVRSTRGFLLIVR